MIKNDLWPGLWLLCLNSIILPHFSIFLLGASLHPSDISIPDTLSPWAAVLASAFPSMTQYHVSLSSKQPLILKSYSRKAFSFLFTEHIHAQYFNYLLDTDNSYYLFLVKVNSQLWSLYPKVFLKVLQTQTVPNQNHGISHRHASFCTALQFPTLLFVEKSEPFLNFTKIINSLFDFNARNISSLSTSNSSITTISQSSHNTFTALSSRLIYLRNK